jgi:RNA polymerase sigma factor (sigma-70 family)
VEEYGPTLERRAQRFPRLTPEQAEDLVNDVWVYALVKLEKVLQHPKPGAWLLIVMGHRYLDYLRSTRPDPFTPDDMERLATEDQRFARFENQNTLRLALQALEPPLAEVMTLKLEGLTLAEIAPTLELSIAEVGRRCARGLRQLGEFIKRNNS